MVKVETLFKTCIYLALEAVLFSKMVCNFGKGYYEEHFYENTLNLDQWFMRCSNVLLIYSSSDSFVWLSRTICTILVEDIMGNLPVKLF